MHNRYAFMNYPGGDRFGDKSYSSSGLCKHSQYIKWNSCSGYEVGAQTAGIWRSFRNSIELTQLRVGWIRTAYFSVWLQKNIFTGLADAPGTQLQHLNIKTSDFHDMSPLKATPLSLTPVYNFKSASVCRVLQCFLILRSV